MPGYGEVPPAAAAELNGIDAYRAQGERSATSSDISAEERCALHRDIELLAAFASAETPAPARQAS